MALQNLTILRASKHAGLRDLVLKTGVSALALMVTTTVHAQVAPTVGETAPQSAAGSAVKAPSSTPGDIATQSTTDQTAVTPTEIQTPADDEGQDIVVTGLRQSLANAQSLKRNADTVVDAVTAEDIGALPDRSVNEALQRIPGIAISRFAAPTDSAHFSVEGSGVTIRGLSYVRGEFNGRDTFAVNAGREIGFNDVPTELVGSIEVYKNLTADLIEGGISGTVNINTRKPFDSKESLLYLSGGLNYGDMERRAAPFAVGLVSKQWDLGNGGRFGLLASGTYSQQRSRSDSVFISTVLPRFNGTRVINAGTPYQSTITDSFQVPSGFGTVYTPTGGGARTQSFDRKRIGFSAAAQYENASRNLLVTAQFLRTDSREEWLERTVEPNVYYNDVGNTFPAPGTSYTYDEDGVFTSGTIAHTGGVPFGNNPNGCGRNGDGSLITYCQLNQFIGGGQFTTLSNRYVNNKLVTQDQALNIKWEPTERLHLNFDGQYVKSTANTLDDILDTGTYSQVNIDLRGKVPQISSVTPGFDTGTYFANPNTLFFRDAFNNRAINDGDEYAFRADAAYDVSETGFLRDVRVGGRYAERQQTVRTNDYNNWGAVSDTWTSGGPISFASLQPGDGQLFNYTDFYRNQAQTPPSAFFVPEAVIKDHAAFTELLRRATKLGGGNYTPLEDRGTDLIKGYFRPSEVYKNGEKTIAGYVRFGFGHEFAGDRKISGNIGLRFVRTENTSEGAITFPNANQIFTPDTAGTNPDGTVRPALYTTLPEYCAYTLRVPPANGVRPAICTVTSAQQAAILGFANGLSQPDNAAQSYTKFLPSLNVRFDLSNKLLLRFAGSKAISRPNFGNLRNFIGISPSGSNTTGNYGFSSTAQNPLLKPIDAIQFDLTAEWYFAKVGSLTGAVFYKDLSNIILDNFGYNRSFTNNGQTFDIQINGPANAKGHASIKGAEIGYQQTFDFLPGALRGLGAQATFTYIDAGTIPNAVPANSAADGNRPPLDVTGLYDNLPLAGLSKYNYNVSAFYDFAGIYARIAYSWRSKFLLTNRDCCFPFLPVFADAGGQADGSLFYTVNKQFKIGVQVQNLLDQTTKTIFRLNGDGLEAPRSFFKSDRQFQLSVRMTL